MKKLSLGLIAALLMFSVSHAQYLIGSRAAGMGGAGVAVANDLSAAYYNPAGLMNNQARAAELKIALGASYSNPDKLAAALSGATDPAKFLSDNFGAKLDFSGNISGIIGLNVRKIGLSVIPYMSATVSKNANSLVGTMNGAGEAAGALTLGTSFSIPGAPIGPLNLGANIKSIYAVNGGIKVNAVTGIGTQQWGIGTGMGFDVGALTTIKVPMISTLSFGAAARNLGQTIIFKNKQQTANPNQGGNGYTNQAAQDLADSTVNDPTSMAIGAAATIPVVNVLVAGDLENVSGTGVSQSNTHFGIEYPLFMNILILRAGMASGASSLTTFGAKIGLPILTLDAAMVTDNNNSKNSSYVVDINLGF